MKKRETRKEIYGIFINTFLKYLISPYIELQGPR